MERDLARTETLEKAKALTRRFKQNKPKFWTDLDRELQQRKAAEIDLEKLRKSYHETFNTKLIQMATDQEDLFRTENEKLLEDINNTVGDVKLSRSTIKRIIKSLSNIKSPGISGTTNEMIKYGGAELTNIITDALELMINYRYIPKELTVGLIFPIVKDPKKDVTDINNTRPITVSETITAILEKYLLEVINAEINEDLAQFGFKANCSTNHAIFVLK